MKRIVKLTEDDLTRIVRRVLSEQPTSPSTGTLPWLPSKPQASATSKPQAPPKTPFFNGKTVNLYHDAQNTKFYSQVKINNVQNLNGKVVIYLTNKGDLSINCSNPNQFNYLEPVSRKFISVDNAPLATQLRKLLCTVNASGTTVPKADFASNTQKPTSDFA